MTKFGHRIVIFAKYGHYGQVSILKMHAKYNPCKLFEVKNNKKVKNIVGLFALDLMLSLKDLWCGQ